MAAYIIVDIDIHDVEGMKEYRERVPATLEKYGGKFLVRGGKFETVEGSWKPTRLVVIEFPSRGAAKRWYDSPEYTPLKAQRFKASKGHMVLVEGV
jgi:uncharacterized protein (DUF1330 family)